MVEKRSTLESSTGTFLFSSTHALMRSCADSLETYSLAALGIYRDGLATNQIDDKPVQAHVYEYTTQMSIAPDLTFKGLEKGIVPVQM